MFPIWSWVDKTIKETLRRRITVTSSLNEISTDQQASGHIFKDDVNGFFSNSAWSSRGFSHKENDQGGSLSLMEGTPNGQNMTMANFK
jgi:hypothetical protein